MAEDEKPFKHPYDDYSIALASMPPVPSKQAIVEKMLLVDEAGITPLAPEERDALLGSLGRTFFEIDVLKRNSRLHVLSRSAPPESSDVHELYTKQTGPLEREAFEQKDALIEAYQNAGNSRELSLLQARKDYDAAKEAARGMSGLDGIEATYKEHIRGSDSFMEAAQPKATGKGYGRLD